MKTNYPEESKVDQTKPQLDILEKVKEEYKTAEFLRESIARDGVAVTTPIPMGSTASPISSRGRAVEIEEAKKQSRRIETKTSKAALMICIGRTASFYEKRNQYRSDDYIAPLLLPRFVRVMLKTKLFRRIFIRIIPVGLYEYLIARTKYIDSVYKTSLNDGFRQVVILGSGFDSRGIRFYSPSTAVRVFELDAPVTQNDKKRRLRKNKINVHDDIVFISIDLDKESAADALVRNGFDKGKKTLFLMEGILMYLSEHAVDSIFHFLHSSSGLGSEVVFDYVYRSVLHKENKHYGEEDAYNYVEKAGERFTFGLEDREVGAFLAGYGFAIQEKMNSDRLNSMYFREENGKRPGVVNDAVCMVRAKKI